MFKQNLRNQQPCNLLPKSPEPYQERRWQSRILHSLTLNHAFSLGHGSIKVLPTPDNMAQQRKGHAKKSYKVFWTMQGFWSLVGKGRMFGRPFAKQILRNYQPCESTPKNSWTLQRTCQSTKHCLSQILPTIFILQLWRNIRWTIETLIVFCFGKRALERNASMFILWTWGGMLLKGIFLSNFWDLYML